MRHHHSLLASKVRLNLNGLVIEDSKLQILNYSIIRHHTSSFITKFSYFFRLYMKTKVLLQ